MMYLTLVCERHPSRKRSARVRVLDATQHTGDEAVAAPRQESDVDPAMEGGTNLRQAATRKNHARRGVSQEKSKKKHIKIFVAV